MTTQMMTAKQAYDFALDMSRTGADYGEISRALENRGYVSWRTKKRIKANGIETMIKRAALGMYPKTDRLMAWQTGLSKREYWAKKKREERARTKAATTTATRSHTKEEITSIWDLAKTIDSCDFFTKETKKALLQLVIDEVVR